MGASIILMHVAAAAYPAKGITGVYWRRKACEGGVVLATFLLVLGNTALELRPAMAALLPNTQTPPIGRLSRLKRIAYTTNCIGCVMISMK